MRRRRFDRRLWILGAVGLFAAVLIGISLGRTRTEHGSAPPAVLNHIAVKNQDAAINAAAQFKAESSATSRAAEARANMIAPAPPANAANPANAQ